MEQIGKSGKVPFASKSRILICLLFFATLTIFVGCDLPEPDVSQPAEIAQSTAAVNATGTQSPTPTISVTPSTTPTNTPTPTATFTPSPTPTPTPTTEPVTVSGDPVAFTHRPVQGTFRTSCGEVDTLDFPMDPPNADNYTRGGRDFGVFRGRYDKYHAGEDWWKSGGALGEPVHAIGNGRITYAQPLGWGRDKGVIIIEHIFNDGRKILSFYGHLDEESFEVGFGQCVTRGQLLATVGNPLTPPHLHFEMRSHAPNETLGGYWGIDPRLAGWVWPSMRIWEERINASAGVQWVRPLEFTGILPIGQLPSGRFGIAENGELQSVDPETGLSRRFLSALEKPTNAVVSGRQLFVTQDDDVGLIYDFNDDNTLNISAASEFPAQPARNQLFPRPGGGVLVAAGQTLVGIDSAGERLWQVDMNGRLTDLVSDDKWIYLTIGDQNQALWRISMSGEVRQLGNFTGKLTLSGDNLWILGEEGVFLFKADPTDPSFQQIKTLSQTELQRSDLVPLQNGGVLIAHLDRDDSRLFAFAADGRQIWERSYRDLPRGTNYLQVVNEQPYLIIEGGAGSPGEMVVYSISIVNNHLDAVFVGGTRFAYPIDTWIRPVGAGRLIINIGGGAMTAIDPESAILELANTADAANN